MQPTYAVVDGSPQLGAFPRALTHPNVDEGPLAPWGLKLPHWLRRLRTKRWWHVAIIHPEIYVGFATIHAGYAASAFVFASPADGGQPLHLRRERLGTKAVQVANPVPGGRTWARDKRATWQINHPLEPGDHAVRISSEANTSGPALELRATLHEAQGGADLAQLLGLDEGHLLYTRKAPWPVSGTLRVGDKTYELDPNRDVALIDEHHATYPYQFYWYWATGAGTHSDGRQIAINLCQNPYSSDNDNNENGIWVDGELHRLPMVTVAFDKDQPLKPWEFADTNGKVRLTFTPHTETMHHQRALLFDSKLLQVRGKIEGYATLNDGSKLYFAELSGLCENHQARL